jgi:hypothetical protein
MSCNNNGDINQTIIIEPASGGGTGTTVTACTGVWTNIIYSCSGDSEIHLTSGSTEFNTDLLPRTGDTISLGTQLRRFREVNTASGYSTMWSATTVVYTPSLDLGLDSLSNSRIITANNSIIQNDYLNGGTY